MNLWISAAGLGAAFAGLTTAAVMHPSSAFGGAVRRGPAGTVSLTFDDGPDPTWTPQVLAALAALDVRASFFVLGDAAANHPELVTRIAAEGHRVEVHGANHRTVVFRGPAALNAELIGVVDRVEALTGRRPRWWRPPFGARPLLGANPTRAGLRLVTWSWSAKDYVLGAAASAALPEVRSGAIALLHDGAGAPSARARTLAALPILVANARAARLTVEPLPDPS